MELWYSFFPSQHRWLSSHSSLIHGLPAMGRSRSGWLRTFQHVLLFDLYSFLISYLPCHLLLLLLLFLRKCPQNLSETLISRVGASRCLFHQRKGRWLFSFGAGNVVYHHLLLYVRNWVVSGWRLLVVVQLSWDGVGGLDGCFGGCAGTLAFG